MSDRSFLNRHSPGFNGPPHYPLATESTTRFSFAVVRLCCTLLFFCGSHVHALSLLTYNVSGNGATDWSTNSTQVQALGRQMMFLKPDVITFQEIPFNLTYQMTNFVKAFLPGYFMASNSGTDGFIRSLILSRYPIVRSQKWLDGVSLADFGYSGTFTRDLFEAEIQAPNFSQPLHVFTTHLKAGTDSNSVARRAAEASAISNFFMTVFLPAKSPRPYVLTGDLNEDINRPPSGSQRPVSRLVNDVTGLRLTTPRNPVTGDERTWSIRSSLSVRYDYVLPGGLLFSNIATSQVFRTDVLNPTPALLQRTDDQIASDHLPVFMVFNNPYDVPFALTAINMSNQLVTLTWQTVMGRQYQVEGSADLMAWTKLSAALTASGTNFIWSTGATNPVQFYRVELLP
jgi:endonuclease/exonuclease/phosphatase family metal-dependent hydrolase